MTNLKKTGKIIAEKRKEKGLNQTQFGKLLGLSRQSVHSIEAGITDISLDTLHKIAEILNISPNEILPNGINQQATFNSGNMTQNVNQEQDNDEIKKDIEIIKLKLDLILEKIDKKG